MFRNNYNYSIFRKGSNPMKTQLTLIRAELIK